MVLRTRKPTGETPAPFIILEGAEKSGKTFSAAKLTASDKIANAYWLDIGEGASDQYAAIPGANYEVIMHDGSYAQILDQITEVTKLPGLDKQGRFNMIIIDSMSNLWELLKKEADSAAREKAHKSLDEDVVITINLWNKATNRLRRIMDLLIAWDGLVIVTARGKEVTAMKNGNPDSRADKIYKLEGHKTLAFDADVIIRMKSPGVAQMTGARSLHVEPKNLQINIANFSKTGLEGVIFDQLKVGQSPVGSRDYKSDKVNPNLVTAETIEGIKSYARTLAYGKGELLEIFETNAVASLDELTIDQGAKLLVELASKVKALEEANDEKS